MKDVDTQTQDAQQTPSRIDLEIHTEIHYSQIAERQKKQIFESSKTENIHHVQGISKKINSERKMLSTKNSLPSYTIPSERKKLRNFQINKTYKKGSSLPADLL